MHSLQIFTSVSVEHAFFKILCFVDRASLYILANKSNQMHNSAQYIYFSSLHVSGNHVLIRRNYCICATLVFVTLYGDKYQCHLHTVIFLMMDARNMQGREINILSRIVHLFGFICKNAFFTFRVGLSTLKMESAFLSETLCSVYHTSSLHYPEIVMFFATL